MPKQIIIAEQHHIAAVFWEDQIQELVVATGNQQVADIYLGLVENVIPGIDAAFVNIGDAERNGFIHVTDLGPLRLKKTAGAITELLAPQQKVLVQVMKEPTGNKGPRLTGNVTLPGRYLVLMPNGRGVNLSRRIRSEDERSRLRASNRRGWVCWYAPRPKAKRKKRLSRIWNFCKNSGRASNRWPSAAAPRPCLTAMMTLFKGFCGICTVPMSIALLWITRWR